MKVLALDISTKTGWGVFEKDEHDPLFDVTQSLIKYGLIKNPKKVGEYGKYPWSYLNACSAMGQQLLLLAQTEKPDVIVIEETNGSKARYTQKVLEMLHCCLLERLAVYMTGTPVYYINSSEWRKTLGLVLSKEDKKNNKKLKVAKKLSEATGKKLNRVELGIRGITNKKHIAVRYVNETYGLNFRIKDNDIADAICLGTAYIKGCKVCDGK
jgi:hypothetical protein